MRDPLQLPTLALSELYHVGSLDIRDKKPYSHEGGHGLSVSTEPDAWRQINRGLTQGSTHTLSRKNGRFIDACAMTDSQRQAVYQWGVEQGYLRPATIYYCEWFDDEQDNTLRFESYDPDDIAIEAEEQEVEPQQREGFKGTEAFACFIGEGNRDAYDLILVVYADQATTYDGVYWADPLDIPRYQAPRGVLLQHQLSSWTITTIDDEATA